MLISHYRCRGIYYLYMLLYLNLPKKQLYAELSLTNLQYAGMKELKKDLSYDELQKKVANCK